MRLFYRLACGFFVFVALLARAQPPLEFTEAERAWLQAHPVIRLGHDPDFKPFCFRDAQGRMQGIDADLLALLERRLGVRFETRSGATWRETYQAALRREVDVLSSTADDPARREHFRFTRDYIRFPVTIVTRFDGPFAVAESDLRGLRVAAPRDYVATLAFRRLYPNVALVDCDSIEAALEMVAGERADAAVTNLTNASYVIKTRGLTNLKIAGVVPQVFELRFAVRNDWPELHGILEKTLANLSPQEMATILDRWVKVDYASVIRWDVVRRWAIVGGVFALTIIALVSWRNASLSRELEKRRVVQAELETAHRRLNEAHGELVARHEEKCELMRMAAHDLRSPLTTIELSAGLFATDADDSRRMIRAAAGQMKQLIDDLLEVHALEEGRKQLRQEPVEIGGLVRAAAECHAPAALAKRISLDAGAVETMPSVLGDAGALRQVFDNLISNALKFSPLDRSVTLRTTRWNEFVRFEVRDEGPGVPAAERERIFSKYARGTAKPTAGERSTGLGLAIVRDIVAIMNGRTWCENAPGGGAIFVVVLPVAATTTVPNGAPAADVVAAGGEDRATG